MYFLQDRKIKIFPVFIGVILAFCPGLSWIFYFYRHVIKRNTLCDLTTTRVTKKEFFICKDSRWVTNMQNISRYFLECMTNTNSFCQSDAISVCDTSLRIN